MGSITIGTRTVTGINLGTGIDVGTKQTSIGTNGVYDVNVFGYASNEITVAVPSVTPVGTISIDTNGTYDVSNYSSAVVSVSTALPDGDFLCFTANADNSTVGITIPSELSATLKFYKSSDKENWTEWDGTAVMLDNIGDKLYVFGDNYYISYSDTQRTQFTMTGSIAASGDVMTILSRDGQRKMTAHAFDGLFKDCASLTSAPNLPVTTLAPYCYYYMFYGCTSLAAAPSLPAMTMQRSCYESMFQSCTALTTAPALPATTLEESCYAHMFRGCTSLTTAPSLPATTLERGCYSSMFYGCTSLTTAPSLPATTLEESCYAHMFQSCTALTTAPNLPATTLAPYCYNYMFYGCTALTSGVDLRHVTTDTTSCCQYMYNGCTNINVVYAPSVDTWTTSKYNNWLGNVAASGTLYQHHGGSIPTGSTSGCPTGWTYVIEAKPITLTAQLSGDGDKSFSYDIDGVGGTVTQSDDVEVYIANGETLTITASANDDMIMINNAVTHVGTTKSYGFNDIISGGTIRVRTYKNIDFLAFEAGEANSTVGMTHRGTNATTTTPLIYISTDKTNWNKWDGTAVTLANVGDKLYVNGGCVEGIYPVTFRGISSSSSNYSKFVLGGSINANGDIQTLLDGYLGYYSTQTLPTFCFYSLFDGCSSLKTAPQLSSTNVGERCYQYMFRNCTALTSAPQTLPATTLAPYCYYYMFQSCTALTTAPALPATTLANYCYSYMFYGCTALTSGVDLRHVTTDTSSCCSSMYNGCINLAVAYTPNVSTWTTSKYYSWLSSVAASGTLYRPSGFTVPEGISGCPSGWTQADYPA